MWHAATLIPNKEDEILITAIDPAWVGIHGPPKELITDGESGIVVSHKTTEYLAHQGIKLHVRGKDQHARYMEREALYSETRSTEWKARCAKKDSLGFPSCVFWPTACLLAMPC